MQTEQFEITLVHKGSLKKIPVAIETFGNDTRITAVIDGNMVQYQQDVYHDCLQPICAAAGHDIELLYRIGKEICRQHDNTQI